MVAWRADIAGTPGCGVSGASQEVLEAVGRLARAVQAFLEV